MSDGMFFFATFVVYGYLNCDTSILIPNIYDSQMVL